jgi:hypothetical protein
MNKPTIAQQTRTEAGDRHWWSWGQAINFMLANYPCHDPRHAAALVGDEVWKSALPTRYTSADGTCLPIDPDEWRRHSAGNLVWEGSEFTLRCIQYEAAAVRRLCAAESS